MPYYVYILYSEKLQAFYKGHTNDLKDRLERHNEGRENFTASGVPWILLWSVAKESKAEAYQLELKLKNLTRQRLISFMLKYKDGAAGADELLLLQQFIIRDPSFAPESFELSEDFF